MEVQSYTKEAYDRLPDQMYWIDKINTWRAIAIRDLNKKRFYPPAVYQLIGELRLQFDNDETEMINDVLVETPQDFAWAQAPEIIGFDWRDISFLGTDKNFSRRSQTAFYNNEGNQYTNHMPSYYLSNDGRIYFRNLPTFTTRFLKMIAVFAHPHLVPGYSFKETSYPVSEAMLPKIEFLLKKEVFAYLGIVIPEAHQDEQGIVGNQEAVVET